MTTLMAAVGLTALAGNELLRFQPVDEPRDPGRLLDHAVGDVEGRQAALAGPAENAQHVVLLQGDSAPLDNG
jgi:hypothetical protein